MLSNVYGLLIISIYELHFYFMLHEKRNALERWLHDQMKNNYDLYYLIRCTVYAISFGSIGGKFSRIERSNSRCQKNAAQWIRMRLPRGKSKDRI